MHVSWWNHSARTLQIHLKEHPGTPGAEAGGQEARPHLPARCPARRPAHAPQASPSNRRHSGRATAAWGPPDGASCPGRVPSRPARPRRVSGGPSRPGSPGRPAASPEQARGKGRWVKEPVAESQRRGWGEAGEGRRYNETGGPGRYQRQVSRYDPVSVAVEAPVTALRPRRRGGGGAWRRRSGGGR